VKSNEDKELQLKSKLLFQVDKPEKKDSTKMNPTNCFNGMDIDSLQNTNPQNFNMYYRNSANQANNHVNIFFNKMI